MAGPKKANPDVHVRPPAPAGWEGWLRSPWNICLLLAVVTAIAFAPVVTNDFVNYDDSDYITANPHVLSGLNWNNLRWAATTGAASNWHPLTWISHMLDVQFFDLKAGAHHLVNVGFHILNSLLLFLLLRRLTSSHWRSAFAAGLFALHPLHVESVAWASERKDVLSTLLFLLTILAYAFYFESRKLAAERTRTLPATGTTEPTQPLRAFVKSERPNQAIAGSAASEVPQRANSAPPFWAQRPAVWYGIALVLFALALLSKPMVVTLPFVLLLLDWWPLGRIIQPERTVSDSTHPDTKLNEWQSQSDEPAKPSTNSGPSAQWSSLVVEKLPFFLLAVLSSYITFVVQQKGGAVSTSLSLGERLANALVSYVRYLGKFFWPQNLSVLYPHPGHWPFWQVIASGVTLLLILAVVLWAGFRNGPRFVAFGWFWFLGTLVPVIGLVQVGIQSMADRYTYIPSIGLLILVVWGLHEIARRVSLSPAAIALAGAAALGLCAVLTLRQVQFWRNSETLFAHAVQVTDKNYLAYNNLGFYLSAHGKIDEAIANYRKSIEINPLYEDALNNLGFALASQRKHAEAIPFYEAALRVQPKHVEVHNNLGNALSETGRADEAIAHYRFVLKEKPEHADAHNNLGIALAMQGKFDEAIGHFQEAIRYRTNYASAHSNLGNAYAVQHKLDSAIKEYKECLRLNPNDPQAHNNLGNALAESGNLQAAAENYSDAIRLNAFNPEAHFNLGLVLARLGKVDLAQLHYAEALRERPNYAEAKRQLELLKASK